MTGLRDELAGIYRREGRLTPELVVDEATPEGAALHHRFEWDNNVAGHKYRLVQARELIRSVLVTYKESDELGPQQARAFVATYKPGDAESQGYVPTEEALADELTATLVLRAFERDLASLRRSYQHLSEFRSLIRRELLDAEPA